MRIYFLVRLECNNVYDFRREQDTIAHEKVILFCLLTNRSAILYPPQLKHPTPTAAEQHVLRA